MCVGCAKLIFSVSFQFYLMAPEEGRVWGQLMALKKAEFGDNCHLDSAMSSEFPESPLLFRSIP